MKSTLNVFVSKENRNPEIKIDGVKRKAKELIKETSFSSFFQNISDYFPILSIKSQPIKEETGNKRKAKPNLKQLLRNPFRRSTIGSSSLSTYDKKFANEIQYVPLYLTDITNHLLDTEVFP